MRVELNKYQKIVLFVVATIIIFVQLKQFNNEGFDGYGWVLSFLVAGALVVVGLNKSSHIELPIKSTPPKSAPLSKEELEIAHATLRENAEVLTIEIEQRASTLANALTKEKDNFNWLAHATQNLKWLVHLDEDNKKSEKLAESLKIHIHEACIYLMLGLVGMRRSKGKLMYITGIECKTIQEKIQKKLVELAIASHKIMPLTLDINAEALSTSIQDDILQIRKAITQYCVAFESGTPEPESSLFVWFESRTGMTVKENPQVTHALYQNDS